MEASNDHKIDGQPASTKPQPTKRHNNDNDNDGNMMMHKGAQAPHQQTPLHAAAQHIVQQEALNGQLEDIEAKDDNKDPDSDNNDKNIYKNGVIWPSHGTEGKKTTTKQKQGLFWRLRQEVQDAIIQAAIEDAPEQQKEIMKIWKPNVKQKKKGNN